MKIFPIVKKITNQTVVIVSGDDVTDERLTYDLPETYEAPMDSISLEAQIVEAVPSPTELGILAVLLESLELHAAAQDDVSGSEAVFPIMESHPAISPEVVSVVADIQDSQPTPNDSVATIIALMGEESSAPVEDVTGTQASFNLFESVSVPADEVALAASLQEAHVHSTDLGTVEIEMILWPDATVSNTGWDSPANMQDKNEGTSATCSASSSGALGTGDTEESTACAFILSLPDPAVDDLSIDSVILEWSVSASTEGTQLTAGRCEVNYQYSLDNGSNWTTFFAQTALVTSTSTLDITAGVGGDWTKLKQFRVRANGTVFSGTGVLSVTTSATWGYARVVVGASKDYT